MNLNTALISDSTPVPFFSFALGFCAKNVGYPLSTIYRDPEKSFFAQLWTREQYGYHSTPFYSFTTYGGDKFTGQVNFPADKEQMPAHGCFTVLDENDVCKLELPDINQSGFVPYAMEFSRLQENHDMPVSLVLGGPFTLAGNICPVELLCKWLLEKPGMVKQILQFALHYLKAIIRYWINTFGEDTVEVQIWEPLTTNQIISPVQFEKLIEPYLVQLGNYLITSKVKSTLWHICGNQVLNLPGWQKVPMGKNDIISINKDIPVDLAIKHFQDKAIIAGNIEPNLIEQLPPQELYNLCYRVLREGKKAPKGFILMPGCELPINTPPYNLYTMVKTINDFNNNQGRAIFSD